MASDVPSSNFSNDFADGRRIEEDKSGMAGNSADQGRSVTSKVAAIITEFTGGNSHQLSELAHRTGLPTSTAHRLLHELVAWGLLSRDSEGMFRPGLMLKTLSSSTVPRPTLEERGSQIVIDLTEALNLPVRLGVLDELEVSYVEKTPGYTPATSFNPAARLPVHATALGKVLLAFAPEEMVLRVIAERRLAARTRHTITRADQLLRVLDQIRQEGYAISRGELAINRNAIAVPVTGPGGLACAAIEVEVKSFTPSALEVIIPTLQLAAGALFREIDLDAHQRHSMAHHVVIQAEQSEPAAG